MQATDDLRKPVRLGALSMAKLTRALLEGPCSIQELQEVSGLSVNTIHTYMRALRKEKAAHISAWEKDATGRDSFRVYKLGPGKDAPRSRKSKAQIAKECRKRKQEALLHQSFAQVIPIRKGPAHHAPVSTKARIHHFSVG